MIKNALAVAALVCAHAAQAQWVLVGPAGETEFYIDRSSIARQSETLRVWEMMSLAKADGEGTHSSRFLIEYDCKGRRSRGLEMMTYAKAMAKGDPIQKLGPDPDGWEAVPPDSIYAERMKMACAN
jgi:hypothetical protein